MLPAVAPFSSESSGLTLNVAPRSSTSASTSAATELLASNHFSHRRSRTRYGLLKDGISSARTRDAHIFLQPYSNSGITWLPCWRTVRVGTSASECAPRSPALGASALQGPSASWLQHSLLVSWRAPAPALATGPTSTPAHAPATASVSSSAGGCRATAEPLVGEYLIAVRDASKAEKTDLQRSASRLNQQLSRNASSSDCVSAKALADL